MSDEMQKFEKSKIRSIQVVKSNEIKVKNLKFLAAKNDKNKCTYSKILATKSDEILSAKFDMIIF